MNIRYIPHHLMVILNILFVFAMVCNQFYVVQWNSRGISNKIEDLLDSFKDKLPDVLVLQETNLIKNSHFEIKGYKTFRFGEKNSGRGTGKGILTAIPLWVDYQES